MFIALLISSWIHIYRGLYRSSKGTVKFFYRTFGFSLHSCVQNTLYSANDYATIMKRHRKEVVRKWSCFLHGMATKRTAFWLKIFPLLYSVFVPRDFAHFVMSVVSSSQRVSGNRPIHVKVWGSHNSIFHFPLPGTLPKYVAWDGKIYVVKDNQNAAKLRPSLTSRRKENSLV
jgi:hypothetical protein